MLPKLGVNALGVVSYEGFWVQRRRWPRASSQIEKETLKKRITNTRLPCIVRWMSVVIDQ
jgi:hypothetical protein